MRQDRVRWLVLGVLSLWSTGAMVGYETADGFVLRGAYSRATGDLHDAVRWSNVPGSLVEQGVRGLGGGIEYAIAGDLCEKMIPAFLDNPKPTCEQFKEVIKRAFDKWAVGHPVLRFTDVTGKITPEHPPAGHRQPWIGFGAEIDLFATIQDLVVAATAYATAYFRRETPPIGTNGKELSGHTITSADIVFNAGACYFLDPALKDRRHPNTGRRCSHFEDLLMHEIGHQLGLDHPHEFPEINYDTDGDPANEIPIDCEDPTKGLKKSSNFDRQSIMSYTHDPNAQLTNDDLGGRNFLYPVCRSVSADISSRTPSLRKLSEYVSRGAPAETPEVIATPGGSLHHTH